MPNTVRLHRVLAMKREKVYRAFIEPDPMVPTWQPGHFQAAPLWQPVGRSGLTVLSNVRCRQLRCVAALGRSETVERQLKRFQLEAEISASGRRFCAWLDRADAGA